MPKVFNSVLHAARLALLAAISIGAAFPVAISAQAKLSTEEIKSLAVVQLAIGAVQDSVDKELAMPRNKTLSMQKELREKMRTEVGAILTRASMSDSVYQRRRFVISTDSASRKAFDAAVVLLSGQPLPGHVAAVAIPAPTMVVPANAMGNHIGHVVNSFNDTPDKTGFLAIATSESKVAQQHAALAMRAPTNLDMMKLHAGHIINALDPTIVTAGPGKQYGVKKAATNMATHVEMAGKAEGSNPNALAQSTLVAAAARSTVARADEIIALAQKIQAATDAPSAAALLAQVVPLCDQLISGFDANKDGKIDVAAPEGGLLQAQQHVALMLAPEKKQ
ncbi:MAG: hypothetical protein ABJC26_18300 [Gemmatimonadaceae bacterium]